jgi:transcriptional regulator with XRE-family HTH domain
MSMTEKIATNIRLLRLKHSLTQNDVAASLNMSRSAYSKIEYGSTHLTYTQALRMSRFYKVDLDYFIFGDE